MPVLATVRNTGSHTAHNIFRDWTLHFLTEDRQAKDALWFGHSEPHNLALIAEKHESDGPLILTMRHPIKVWGSWRKRGKDPDHTFRTMWSNLFSLKDRADSFWMPVDTDDRGQYLDRIEERLDRPLNRDWTPKGVFQITNQCHGGMTLEELHDFVKTLPFEQFYGDIG